MTAKPLTLVMCAATLLTPALAAPAAAETVVFQDGTSNALVAGYTGTEDTTLLDGSSTNRNANFGGFNALFIGNQRRALLRFDLSSMAGEFESINSATLTLTASAALTGGASTYSLYSIVDANAGWQEGDGASTAAADAGESTWNNRNAPATAWAGGIGLDPVTDYDAVAVATITPGTVAAGDTFDITLPTSLIAQWIDGTNAGLFLRADVESSGTPLLQIRSAEGSTVGERPELTLEYTVPEPGSMGLLGVAGAAVMLRRRRIA